MQTEILAKNINQKGFATFIIALVLFVATILITLEYGNSPIVISIQFSMCAISFIAGCVSFCLKTLSHNTAKCLVKFIRIILALWIVLGILCTIFLFLEEPRESFSHFQEIGMLILWFFLFFSGVYNLYAYKKAIKKYKKALSRRERGYDDNLIVPPYEEVPTGLPGYMQEPQYVNPHSIMIDQPIYYPDYRNNENLIDEHREQQYDNDIGNSTHIPPAY